MPTILPLKPLPLSPDLAGVAVHYEGTPLKLNNVIGHLPGPATKFTELLLALYRDEGLTLKDKELVILRTAQRRGCNYIFSQHAQGGARGGITPEQMAALASGELAAATWSEAEAAVLALVDDLDQLGRVGEAGAAVAKHFEPGQIVGLQMIAAAYRGLSAILLSAGLSGDRNVPDHPIAGAR